MLLYWFRAAYLAKVMETIKFIELLLRVGCSPDIDNLFNLNHRAPTAGTMPFFAYEMTAEAITITPTLRRDKFSLPAESWAEAQRLWKAVYAFDLMLRKIYDAGHRRFVQIVYGGWLKDGFELKAETPELSTLNMPCIRLTKTYVMLNMGTDYKQFSLTEYDSWLQLFSDKSTPN